jgi:hypothetical protein
MKKILSSVFGFGSFLIFLGIVSAASYTINGSVIGTTELTGSSVGNKIYFDVDLNVSTLPKDLVINSATLQFNTIGTSLAGDVKIIDKYKPTSSNLIDIISLDYSGQKQSISILSNVKEWYANSLVNYGISFASKDFSSTDNIVFSNIKLLIDTSLKDTTAPLITKNEIIKTDLEEYKFILETDELTSVVVNFGKTSVYDQKAASELPMLSNHEIILANLQNGVTYHYQIVVTDESGNKTTTKDATFLTSEVFETQTSSYIQDDSLFPPNNLNVDLAKKGDKYSVILSWTPSINENFDGYIIFRKAVDSNNYVELDKISYSALEFTDDSVEAGIEYDYLINSYNDNKISLEGAKAQIIIPSDAEADSSNSQQTTYNTGQILLILFAVAVTVFIVGYLIVKYGPRLIVKKQGKESLKNILKDPSRYEDKVATEFGSVTEGDYPAKEPTPGRDMN